MTGYLIPIKALTSPALAAVRFALEFGKRNGGTFTFLFVQDPSAACPALTGDAEKTPKTGATEQENVRKTIEEWIVRARTNDGTQTKIEYRYGDFIQEVREFVRNNHIAEIILGVCDEPQEAGAKTRQDALLLLQLTHCRILTVKPKAKEFDPLWSQLH
jgi:hypothetical protein